MTLFGPAPRQKVKRRPTKPSWTRVHAKSDRLKVGARCGPCMVRLHGEWGTGVPYVPAGTPTWRRTQGELVEHYCEMCAAPVIARDRIDYPTEENPR